MVRLVHSGRKNALCPQRDGEAEPDATKKGLAVLAMPQKVQLTSLHFISDTPKNITGIRVSGVFIHSHNTS
jgi:hypothetical protein